MNKRLLLGVLAIGLSAVTAGSALARDLAVIVANQEGQRRGTLNVPDMRKALRDAGFDLVVIQNATAEEMQTRLIERRRDLSTASRLVVVVAGRVATDGHHSWLLGNGVPNANTFNVGARGLPLTAFYPYFADVPGAALLAVVSPTTGRIGSGLEPGYLPGDLPQGLTVLSGSGSAIGEILGNDILQAGLSTGAAVEAANGEVVGYGFLPKHLSFLPREDTNRSDADRAEWTVAQSADNEAGYERYLSRFPDGDFAPEARARLQDMRQSPAARAEAAEAALRLDRDTKREIQRNLSILGYDPRGIDGIFGRGTRRAIATWQRDQNFGETGFMTGDQVAKLRQDGAARQAQLEEDARRRQEEADQRDTAYWRDTGRGETEQGLREYLARYPDGLFSELATGRLDAIEAERRETAAAAESRDWEATRNADTVVAYQRYLQRYPNGVFASEADARMRELRDQDNRGAEIEQARANEARVLANPITRLLVERRLQQLGLKPGNADGKFDEATRKAIRRYQRARELPVTGFVTQQTLVRLLSG